MTHYPTSLARGEIKPLTGLRGLAALAVMVHHFEHPGGVQRIPTLFDVPFGYMAVDLFFVLSGFVLFLNYANSFRTSFDFSRYGDFLLKRIVRIGPAYWGLMVLYVCKMVLDFTGVNPLSFYDGWDMMGNIFILTGWGFGFRPIIGPSWSVSAEMFCYVAFPLIVLCLMGRTVLRLIFVTAILVALGCLLAFGNGAQGPLDIVLPSTPLTLLRALIGFTIGGVCYLVYSNVGREHAALGSKLLIGALLLLLGGCIYGRSELVVYVAIVLLVYASALNGRLANLLFANKITHFLGDISYSMYLFHGILLGISASVVLRVASILPYNVAHLIVLALFVLVVICGSYVSYVLFELKARKFLMGNIRVWRSRSA